MDLKSKITVIIIINQNAQTKKTIEREIKLYLILFIFLLRHIMNTEILI